MTRTIPITETLHTENYFIISPGLGGFPANSVFITNPHDASSDDVFVDTNLTPFITGIVDSSPGHAGITFDTVGSFNYALIVTTPSAVYGFDKTGTQIFNYAAPGNGVLLESATVAPSTNTACPGCLYITADKENVVGGSIYTVTPNAISGTPLNLVATLPGPGREPENILFVTKQVCTLTGTNYAYFVSGHGAGANAPYGLPYGISHSGRLLAYTNTQISGLVGQALIPIETGNTIYAFDPKAKTFSTFSMPIPVPPEDPPTFQLEGASMVACPAPVPVNGRMTGGGSFFRPDGTRVTHGLELHCSVPSHPNTLEVNWGGGNNFHLDNLAAVTCFLDPTFSPGHPNANFNTMIGSGTGTLNGAPATITFEFTDSGEPGTSDQASVTIQSGGGTPFTVPLTTLDKGNQQAHK